MGLEWLWVAHDLLEETGRVQAVVEGYTVQQRLSGVLTRSITCVCVLEGRMHVGLCGMCEPFGGRLGEGCEVC
jgi:hypothetical protein